MPPPEDVTTLLQSWSKGDQAALDKLVPLIYSELRRLADYYLRHERPNHTLESTALVHEVYLQLVDWKSVNWKDRLHFFAAASQAMRRILIDHARGHRAAKRGGKIVKATLGEAMALPNGSDINMVALDDALSALEAIDPEKSRIVELRFFGGLSLEETAAVTGVSVTTVTRQWRSAKAWLHREISKENVHDAGTLAAG
jgi:RNA polymerase sigma factor (TIGR02999 family)